MRLYATICLLVLAMTSCRFESTAYVAETSVTGWRQAAVLRHDNRDTTSVSDISIFVRYYPEMVGSDSLRLHVVTTTPSERRVGETVTLRLASNDSLSGHSAQFVERPYRTNVVWSERGEYQVAIYPTVPTDGVEAVGITLKLTK